MKHSRLLPLALTLALAGFASGPGSPVSAGSYCGIDFPDGDSSFADEVADVTPGDYQGETPQSNPEEALGPPNAYPNCSNNQDNYWSAYSLGAGGEIVLKFNNTVLRGDGSSKPDLYIFESGDAMESMEVWVSPDGQDWTHVATTSTNTATTGIDLDAQGVGPDAAMYYVRIQDAEQNEDGARAGADVDAVGANPVIPKDNGGNGGGNGNGSGGDDGPGTASAGNGGYVESEADGGSVTIGQP